ncbi:hypothetical protein CNE_1c03170 [Cupriavidus necator N-1]|uniref:Aldehyde dehydrogenase domain-containing protein n=1 Tax=Cupriavidus necator (strain ATCC 43291 / DSM 13513 / CCUG 52238 / LMG 8453 / N-1) TaxID=1042878 RepID=G0EU19_CUPNN|nr:aldehyde dehydrogenase family protein [Cupriavidus necator]AEI75684.1 hypothetical protein CNE_1c03170 [Cupriavidus necator N-1]MDX6012175.1 aldehyde dehydrogenase family protein [Cupriavidus necator]
MVPAKLRYYAGLALTEYGRAAEPRPGRLSLVLREPMGVAGIIAPWNSPVVLMVRSLAPALAAGCTAVIKMPGQTALTNALVARIMARALEAGTVWINNWASVYDEFEEGGYKQSGQGRLNGVAAIDDFVEYKHIALAPG